LPAAKAASRRESTAFSISDLVAMDCFPMLPALAMSFDECRHNNLSVGLLLSIPKLIRPRQLVPSGRGGPVEISRKADGFPACFSGAAGCAARSIF
jgi:hypothetical protein